MGAGEAHQGTGDRLRVWKSQEALSSSSPPLWLKNDTGERYQSLLQLYRTPTGLLLTIDCEGKGAFEYRQEGVGICWDAKGTGPAHYFQTLGLALWLEQQGVPCIHANGVAIDDYAIGMIGASRTGKTTLTAALLEFGAQMLSDDMMTLRRRSGEWMAAPGWPQFRMWPDTASRFVGNSPDGLPRVHERFEKRALDLRKDESKYCRISRPLRRLYLLERRKESTGEIETRDVPHSEALIHLLQNSMLGDAYASLGLDRSRLAILADLVADVGLTRISYPSGMSHLPELCRRLLYRR